MRTVGAVLLAFSIVAASSGTALAQASSTIRVDLQPSFGSFGHTDYSGVDPVAAGLNQGFADDGVNSWNHLGVGSYPSFTTGPGYNNLVASDGSATSVYFTIGATDSVSAASDLLTATGSVPLTNDYFLITGGSVSYEIGGLTPNARYAFITYGPQFTINDRSYELSVNGDTLTVQNGATPYAYTTVEASATGTISGIWTSISTGPNNEANWSGFQLAIDQTPEPGAWAMMILGFGAVGGAMRTRRNRSAAIA